MIRMLLIGFMFLLGAISFCKSVVNPVEKETSTIVVDYDSSVIVNLFVHKYDGVLGSAGKRQGITYTITQKSKPVYVNKLTKQTQFVKYRGYLYCCRSSC